MIGVVLLDSLWHGSAVPGWLSVISAVLIFGGIQSLILGLLGEYVGRIFLTVSGKPQSFVRSLEAIEALRPQPLPHG
jgi:undecaprenyl-phosphate 4-deoxy-4-formamido-L-arabinose transferase